jgi:Spy/CpxP family protein refolding chaperone
MRFRTFVGLALAFLVSVPAAFAAAPVSPQPSAADQPAVQGAPPQRGPWRHHHRAMSPAERPLITFMLRHSDDLALTPAQVQALEKLRSDFQGEATRLGNELRTAETDLAQLLSADQPDLTRVDARVRDVERLRADFRIARIHVIEEGKAQLTTEQRGKLATLIAQMPAHPRRAKPQPRNG